MKTEKRAKNVVVSNHRNEALRKTFKNTVSVIHDFIHNSLHNMTKIRMF